MRDLSKDYLSQDLGIIGPDDIVEVVIDHPANVQLLDLKNFQAYENRQPFSYQDGGYARTSPYRLQAPYEGQWFVVVDLGGGPGEVRGLVRILPPTATAS
jgi:hypothetical protein